MNYEVQHGKANFIMKQIRHYKPDDESKLTLSGKSKMNTLQTNMGKNTKFDMKSQNKELQTETR